MTLRYVCIGLCIANLIYTGLLIALSAFIKHLINKCNHYEAQGEYKTELICIKNSQLDEAQTNYNELEKAYKQLKNERKKDNGRG